MTVPVPRLRSVRKVTSRASFIHSAWELKSERCSQTSWRAAPIRRLTSIEAMVFLPALGNMSFSDQGSWADVVRPHDRLETVGSDPTQRVAALRIGRLLPGDAAKRGRLAAPSAGSPVRWLLDEYLACESVHQHLRSVEQPSGRHRGDPGDSHLACRDRGVGQHSS